MCVNNKVIKQKTNRHYVSYQALSRPNIKVCGTSLHMTWKSHSLHVMHGEHNSPFLKISSICKHDASV